MIKEGQFSSVLVLQLRRLLANCNYLAAKGFLEYQSNLNSELVG